MVRRRPLRCGTCEGRQRSDMPPQAQRASDTRSCTECANWCGIAISTSNAFGPEPVWSHPARNSV